MRYNKVRGKLAAALAVLIFFAFLLMLDDKFRPKKKTSDQKKPSEPPVCHLLKLSVPTTLQSFETHMKILSTRQPVRSERPRKCANCNIINYKPIILSNSVCAKSGSIDLLVLITTTPSAKDAREAMRKSWLTHTKKNSGNVRHVFLLGGGWSGEEQAQLHQESNQYGDILQHDYKDAYYNLSYKVMSGFQWALKYCSQAKFILRTADDNFVNIPRTLSWITQFGKNSMHAQIGFIHWRLEVWREMTRKWYISYTEFPEPYYPPYAMGTAFLYSLLAVKEVVKEGPNIPFFCIEDVWLGFVMREIKMPVIGEPLFFKELTQTYYKTLNKCVCPFDDNFLALHLVTPGAMPHLWNLCTSARLIDTKNN